MNMDYCKPYAGRDTVILDRHAADTIAEDIRAFDSQLENHFAHVIMLAEQKIITRQDAAAILKALLKLKEMGDAEAAKWISTMSKRWNTAYRRPAASALESTAS